MKRIEQSITIAKEYLEKHSNRITNRFMKFALVQNIGFEFSDILTLTKVEKQDGTFAYECDFVVIDGPRFQQILSDLTNLNLRLEKGHKDKHSLENIIMLFETMPSCQQEKKGEPLSISKSGYCKPDDDIEKVNFYDWLDKINCSMCITSYPNQQDQQENRFKTEIAACEVMDDSALTSFFGNGKTPSEAIRDYLPKIEGQRIVINAGLEKGRCEYRVPEHLFIPE